MATRKTVASRKDGADADLALKREVAGRYRTADGRFTVEESSGRWLLIDSIETDELGLPLIRGPFGTLDEARSAIATARAEPAPASDLKRRLAERPRATGLPDAAVRGGRSRAGRAPPEPEAPEVRIREYRRSDGEALRELWREAGFRLRGDDDDSLSAMARRNPGLLLVAAAGKAIVGSALGAWDGRHGWIYHMATARSHRRTGVGALLVREVERRLGAVGCTNINVNVGEANEGAQRFWKQMGYPAVDTRRFRRELSER